MTDSDRDEARDAREVGTEDERLIPAGLALDDALDAEMDIRTAECERDGHRWSDDQARELCVHCGRRWASASN